MSSKQKFGHKIIDPICVHRDFVINQSKMIFSTTTKNASELAFMWSDV